VCGLWVGAPSRVLAGCCLLLLLLLLLQVRVRCGASSSVGSASAALACCPFFFRLTAAGTWKGRASSLGHLGIWGGGPPWAVGFPRRSPVFPRASPMLPNAPQCLLFLCTTRSKPPPSSRQPSRLCSPIIHIHHVLSCSRRGKGGHIRLIIYAGHSRGGDTKPSARPPRDPPR